MKKIVVAAVIAIWCVPSATVAGERVGDAALGGLSGAVVLGPVGAVAGAVIGYTAGPSIADSWRLRRSDPAICEAIPQDYIQTSIFHASKSPRRPPSRCIRARRSDATRQA